MIAPKESTPDSSRAYTDASDERLYEDTWPNADSPGLPPSAPGESFPSWLRHYDRSQALQNHPGAARSRSKALVGIMCMAGTLALLTVLCCVLAGLWEVRFSDVAIAVALFGGWLGCRELGR